MLRRFSWLVIVLAVLLVASSAVFAQQTLRVLLPIGGGYTEEDQQAIAQGFMRERPGVDVQMEFVGWDALWDRIITSIGSGNPPDVIYIGSRWIPALADLGAIVPLDQYVSDAKRSLYFDSVWDSVTYNGQVWGVVRAMSTKAVLYNKDVFAQAGVVVPTNWDELLAAARTISETTNVAGFGLPANPFVSTVTEWQNFLFANGASIVDPDSLAATINSPAAVHAFEYYFRDLAAYAQAAPTEWRREDLIRLFSAGQIAMYTDHIHSATQAQASGVNVGIFQLPGGPSGTQPFATVLVTDSMAIPAQSRNQALAVEFIEYMTSPEQQLVWDLSQGFIPPMHEEAEADAFQHGFWPQYIEAAQYGVPEAVDILDWEATQDAILTAIHRYMLGQGTSQQVLDQAARTINQLQGR